MNTDQVTGTRRVPTRRRKRGASAALADALTRTHRIENQVVDRDTDQVRPAYLDGGKSRNPSPAWQGPLMKAALEGVPMATDTSASFPPTFSRWVELSRDQLRVEVKSIPRLVLKAIASYSDRKHEGDGEAGAESGFQFGFNNRSTEMPGIANALRKLRDADRIRVEEDDDLGPIEDDDVERGWLSREGFATLLADRWRMGLQDESGAVTPPAGLLAPAAAAPVRLADASSTNTQDATGQPPADEPASDHSGKVRNAEPRVTWLRGLYALLPEITRDKQSRKVMTVLRELKTRGVAYNILDSGRVNELQWKDDQSTVQTVSKKTVSNEIARALKATKAAREIPD